MKSQIEKSSKGIEEQFICWLKELREDTYSKTSYYLVMTGIGVVWGVYIGIIIAMGFFWLPTPMATVNTVLIVIAAIVIIPHQLCCLGRDVKRYEPDEGTDPFAGLWQT